MLVYYNRKCGMNTSGLLFLFWFLLFLCGIPQFRTELREMSKDTVNSTNYGMSITYSMYFVIVIAIFLLNCISDKPPLESDYAKEEVSQYTILSNYLLFK